MNLKVVASFAAAVAAFALISCNSTESDADISASLMAHPWKIVSATASPAVTKNGVLITNVLDSLQGPCDKHTIAHYLSGDSISVTSDSLGCGAGHGTWTRNGFVVTTIFPKETGPDTTVNTVVSVSTTQLVFTWITVQTDGPHTVTETYIAQ